MTSAVRTSAAILVLAACSTAQAGDVKSMVLFGDSLSDSGNVYFWTGGISGYEKRPAPPWYTAKKFTDGKDNTGAANAKFKITETKYEGVWHDKLAGGLGVNPLVASTTDKGTNYAYGGATSGTGVFSTVLLNVGDQVKQYIESKPTITDETLLVLWAGGNDVRDAAIADGATKESVRKSGKAASKNIEAYIEQLIAKMDQTKPMRFLWPNLPPMDKIPDAKKYKPEISEGMGLAADDFRAEQLQAAARLTKKHAKLDLHLMNVHGFFAAVAKKPATFGLKNINEEVITVDDYSAKVITGKQKAPNGTNPDTYVFWDPIHPTSRIHAAIGELAVKSVPAPGALGLLGIGVMAIARRRR